MVEDVARARRSLRGIRAPAHRLGKAHIWRRARPVPDRLLFIQGGVGPAPTPIVNRVEGMFRYGRRHIRNGYQLYGWSCSVASGGLDKDQPTGAICGYDYRGRP